MALINPNQLREVMKPASTVQVGGTTPKNRNIKKLLEDSNLTPEEVLENLSSLMRSGETDGVRLRAAETACKINGLLNAEEGKSDFNVTIIIQDSEFQNSGINPILIPRQ